MPAMGAKKVRVGGKVSITIPGFSPDTGQSLASGRVKAKRGCDGLRVVRFAYFGAEGLETSQELTSVVSQANGRYLVALPQPSSGTSPYTLRIFVQARQTTFRGGNVNCKVIRGAAPVPSPPQPAP
jgi:hypothetical protein